MNHLILLSMSLLSCAFVSLANDQSAGSQRPAAVTMNMYSKNKKVAPNNLTYLYVGWTMYDLDDLNESTKIKGANTRGNSAVQFGVGHEKYANQVVFNGNFGISLWTAEHNDSIRTNLAELDLGYAIGWDLIKINEIKLYPYLGMNVGWIFYKTGLTDLPFDSLYTQTTPQDFRLDQISVKINVGLGYNVTTPKEKRRPAIGLKGGYMFDVSSEDKWYRGYSSIKGGPSLKASGPYVKLVIGMRRHLQVD